MSDAFEAKKFVVRAKRKFGFVGWEPKIVCEMSCSLATLQTNGHIE